jgi:hypothetical protein
MIIDFIRMHPLVFFCIRNERIYAVQHKTLMSYRTLLRVSVRVNHRQTLFFNVVKKEVPDDGLREPKHVAMCDMTLKSCVGRHIFDCL